MDLIEQAQEAHNNLQKARSAVGWLDKHTQIKLTLDAMTPYKFDSFYLQVERIDSPRMLSYSDNLTHVMATALFDGMVKKHNLME